MSTVRPNLKAFAYFDHTSDECIASTGFAVLTAKEGVDPRFILYSILSNEVSAQIEAHVVGSNYPAINSKDVRRLQIMRPPPPEQRKIAKILTTLDNQIENTEALIAKYQAIKQGMMHDLFTRGVDEHGHLRPSYAEAPDLYKSSELGWIPKEWETSPLVNFAAEQPGAFVNGPFGSNLLTTELTDEGVPVIYVRDIKPGQYQRVSTAHITVQKANQLTICSVLPNDVLIAKVGDPPCDAAPYLEKRRAVITQDVIRIRPAADVDTLFLTHLINSSVGREAVRRITIEGTRARVSLTELKALLMPKPPLPEQQALGERLESLLSRIKGESDSVAKLNQIKTGLMQVLLTGKVRVKVDESEEVAAHA